eukprot:CAMPEP_0172492820 /NCGR_PEP_ID=MMETSP1066-20121228/24077_1 /TAXON_ID=671091 /ORGANISM="Coscinodiscus wailesii, Strain CCMP2513" /LENGTH=67 /DNA_ID=CAMNT_0013262639 /DNA_START=503 /DNA_END=706 /DNA_ORIENTATION=-
MSMLERCSLDGATGSSSRRQNESFTSFAAPTDKVASDPPDCTNDRQFLKRRKNHNSMFLEASSSRYM